MNGHYIHILNQHACIERGKKVLTFDITCSGEEGFERSRFGKWIPHLRAECLGFLLHLACRRARPLASSWARIVFATFNICHVGLVTGYSELKRLARTEREGRAYSRSMNRFLSINAYFTVSRRLITKHFLSQQEDIFEALQNLRSETSRGDLFILIH